MSDSLLLTSGELIALLQEQDPSGQRLVHITLPD